MDYLTKIARNVASIPRSGIRDFFDLVQGRDDVISLGVGEPDFVTPWHIREAAIYSLEKGQTTYTSNLGLLSLRKAISRYVSGFFNVDYDPAGEVLVTVGVSEAIDLALRALLNPGDEVIYHEPCYVSYCPSIVMAHAVAVPVVTTKEDGFSLKPEKLAAAITPKTRLIMLNFPTNPTGACATRADLEGIAKLAIKHDLLVLTDDIYSELRYDDEAHVSIAALPGMRERTILLHGFSKAFAMTGFRLGYACAPQPIIEAMMKIHQYTMLCAPIMSQNAAIEALENGTPAMLEMRASYHQRRDFLVRRLRLPSAGRCLLCFPGHPQLRTFQQGIRRKIIRRGECGLCARRCFRPVRRGFPPLLLRDCFRGYPHGHRPDRTIHRQTLTACTHTRRTKIPNASPGHM